MSDRYYDVKGIEHYSERGAKYANESYVREEEKARADGLELQREQAKSAERAAAEARRYREEQAEAEATRLSELKRQGAAAQRDRDYDRRVQFLKDSDEAARLQCFVELLCGQLDPECYPGEDKGWQAEQERLLARFYKRPSLPNECGPNGGVTERIRVFALLAEKASLGEELQRAEAARGGAVAQFFSRIAPSTSDIERKYELDALDERKSVVTEALERCPNYAVYQAGGGGGRQAAGALDQWLSLVRTAYLKGFFEQGLWIGDQFTTRLQAVLTELQKPYPTGCRCSVSGLSREQIESAYRALAAAAAAGMAEGLSRCELFPEQPLISSLIPRSDWTRGPRRQESDDPILQMMQAGGFKDTLIKVYVKWGIVLGAVESLNADQAERQKLQETLLAGLAALKAVAEAAPEPVLAETKAAAAAPPDNANTASGITEDWFRVVLRACPADKKIAIIKAVREVQQIGLAEAKALVERAPTVCLTGVTQAKADLARKQLESAGASVSIEPGSAPVGTSSPPATSAPTSFEAALEPSVGSYEPISSPAASGQAPKPTATPAPAQPAPVPPKVEAKAVSIVERPAAPAARRTSNATRVPTALCGIFLGWAGVHKFMLGYTKQGVIQLFLGICVPFAFLLSVVEGIIYLTKSNEEFRRIYVEGEKRWF
jgi:ribosomal protein L7/L12